MGGWVQKVAVFADIQYCIFADIVCKWVGQERSKNVPT